MMWKGPPGLSVRGRGVLSFLAPPTPPLTSHSGMVGAAGVLNYTIDLERASRGFVFWSS